MTDFSIPLFSIVSNLLAASEMFKLMIEKQYL